MLNGVQDVQANRKPLNGMPTFTLQSWFMVTAFQKLPFNCGHIILKGGKQ